MENGRFLGLDLSTQSLTAVVVDISNGDIQQAALNFEVRDRAALGAALRAAHCHLNNQGISECWKELMDPFIQEKIVDIVQPDKGAVEIYHGVSGLLKIYSVCERYALGSDEDPEKRITQFRKTLS